MNSYAQILYDTVANKATSGYELLVFLEALKGDKKIKLFFESPGITKEAKKEMINNLGFSNEIANFLKILVDENVINKYEQIVEDYRKIFLNKENILEITIYTAKPLSLEGIKHIVKLLEEKTKKIVVLKPIIKSGLIGGAKFEYNNNILDNTIKSRLNGLKEVVEKGAQV